MAHFAESASLEESQQTRLTEIAERFERAWNLDPKAEVDLAAFLPPLSDARLPPTMRLNAVAPAGLEYRLLEPLRDARGRPAKGAFGEVWRAEAPGEIVVAVKIIPAPPMGSDAADSSAFSTEKAALELIKN